MPDNQTEIPKQEPGYTEVQYLSDVFGEMLDSALNKYKNPESDLKIPNEKLEDWIYELWNDNDEELKSFLRRCREVDKTIELNGGRVAHLLETSDLAIHNMGDTAFFYAVDACLATVIDFVDEHNKPLRLSVHLSGAYIHNEMVVNYLLNQLGGVEKINNVLIMYNSNRGYGKLDENKYQNAIGSYKYELVDMDGIDPYGSHDVIVRDDSAKIYHNHGHFDVKLGKWIEERVFGGEIKLS